MPPLVHGILVPPDAYVRDVGARTTNPAETVPDIVRPPIDRADLSTVTLIRELT